MWELSRRERIYYASYFLEAGNLNGSNADMCSEMAWPLIISSGDLFELSDIGLDSVLLLFPPLLVLQAAILHLSATTTPIIPFGACHVIMHKVH